MLKTAVMSCSVARRVRTSHHSIETISFPTVASCCEGNSQIISKFLWILVAKYEHGIVCHLRRRRSIIESRFRCVTYTELQGGRYFSHVKQGGSNLLQPLYLSFYSLISFELVIFCGALRGFLLNRSPAY